MREHALEYAANGFPVVALFTAEKGKCACSSARACKSAGKHPRLDLCPHGKDDATTDPKVIAKWPDEGINIGVVLGQVAGGVMVFDVDDREVARRLLAPAMVLDDQTGVVFTGRAGCHIYFTCSGDTSTFYLKHEGGGKIGEVRGDGAYVVVPPSMGMEGRPYAWRGSLRNGSAPTTAHFQHVADARAYVIGLLESVGVTVAQEQTKARVDDEDAPQDPIYPCEIPPELVKDSRLFHYRTVFAGSVRPSQHDRSGQLFGLAQALAEVAVDKGYFEREILAGVLKLYDMRAFDVPKYAERQNGDQVYWREACRALKNKMEASGQDSKAVKTKVKAEDGDAPAPTPARRSDYVWDEQDGWLYYRATRVFKKVCSFRPEILEEREHYFGYGTERERESSLSVRLTLKGGQSHELKLTSSDLASAQKLEASITRMCPSAYYLAAGMAGHLKAALYDMTQDAPTRRIYATTGWIEYEDGFAYLLPSSLGAIAADTQDPNVRVDADEAGTAVLFGYGKHVRPPLTDEEKEQAWEAFQALVDSGAREKTLPVIMQVLAGPLATAIGDHAPPFVHVSGKTGTLKTSFCLTALSLFGQFKASPASWSLTPTALQVMLHAAKDVTLLMDDYKKALTRDRDGLLSVINNFADRTVRLRSNARQEMQASLNPRGLILSNGEDVWEEEASAQARVVLVDISRDDLNSKMLKEAQQAAASGALQLFGGAYASWMAGRPDVLDGTTFKGLHAEWHARLDASLKERTHRRLVSTVASLMATATIVRQFAEETYGREGARYLKELNKTLLDALSERMTQQAQDVELQAPGDQLIREVVSGILQGQACLRPYRHPSRELRSIPAQAPGSVVVGIWFPIGRNDPEPGEVLLSREMTYAWFASRQIRAGSGVRFSWHQCRRELVERHNGREVRNASMTVNGQRFQVSGVVLPYEVLESHIRNTEGNSSS
jgi:hypothetical protein